jgi:hypothetical protein
MSDEMHLATTSGPELAHSPFTTDELMSYLISCELKVLDGSVGIKLCHTRHDQNTDTNHTRLCPLPQTYMTSPQVLRLPYPL